MIYQWMFSSLEKIRKIYFLNHYNKINTNIRIKKLIISTKSTLKRLSKLNNISVSQLCLSKKLFQNILSFNILLVDCSKIFYQILEPLVTPTDVATQRALLGLFVYLCVVINLILNIKQRLLKCTRLFLTNKIWEFQILQVTIVDH